ncbi:MAG: pyridoxamine 5'-phosphate oxidase family protein [Dehalococcoidia bacterium]
MNTTTSSRTATIEDAIEIAHHVVWGVMTTVDSRGRPRSRLVHPVWTLGLGEPVGWLTTRKTPLKTRHLAGNPHVSIAYIAANTDFAYFDCTAEWADDLAGRQLCWDTFVEAPEPVRYDPATIWKDGPASEDFAALRFTPYRVTAGRAERIARGERAAIARLDAVSVTAELLS